MKTQSTILLVAIGLTGLLSLGAFAEEQKTPQTVQAATTQQAPTAKKASKKAHKAKGKMKAAKKEAPPQS